MSKQETNDSNAALLKKREDELGVEAVRVMMAQPLSEFAKVEVQVIRRPLKRLWSQMGVVVI